MENEVEIVQVRPWYHKPAPWIALGVFICLCVLAMPHVQRRYHRWSEVRKVKKATEALARGDYKEAALQARGALATDPKHIEAFRVLARMAETLNIPAEGLKLRRQIDAIKPGDTENILGLADNCVKLSLFGAAQEALRSLPVQDQSSARYYDIAAAIALNQNDSVSAEIYAAKASKAEPANQNYRLRLAGLRLRSKTPELRAESLQVLQELVASPETRSRALRVQLHDALERGESADAIELGAALSTSSEATFADKLTHLGALYILRESRSGAGRPVSQNELTARLEELQKEAAPKPDAVYQMVMWMNEHNMALLVSDYAAALPAEQLGKPPVSVAVADAYRRGSQWADLRRLVETANWDRADFLRVAFLSRALDGIDDHPGSVAAWTRAVEATQMQTDRLEALAKEVAKWGWKQQSDEILWKLVSKPPCSRWVVDNLWASALLRQDATQLYKLSKLILEAEPKSVVARNHFIGLSLITGQENDRPQELAEAHYQKHPENIAVASTHAFSLFLQGRAEEAVKVMSAFPPEQLRSPAVSFYQGIFLAAAGRTEEGEEYFRAGEQAPQFEQLIAIRNFLRTVFEADAAERRGDPAKSAPAWQAAMSAAQTRLLWLQILGRVALQRGRADIAGEAALKLADLGKCPAWAVEPLWTASLRSGDPARIQKASKVILDQDPKSLRAQGNFVLALLLAGKDGDSAGRQAEALAKGNAGQLEAVAPYAYFLYRQGRGDDALALLVAVPAAQLKEPRAMLYRALILASLSRPDEAKDVLPADGDASLFPEERAMHSTLRLAFDCRTADQGGDVPGANAAWSKAIAQTQGRADLLETLGRMAQKWDAPERVEEALWKLADAPDVSRWVVDALVASAEKRRDTVKLYRAVRLLRRAEPQSLPIRKRYVRLALLTGQTLDKPDRMARELSESYPADPEIASIYALALHQQGRNDVALSVLGTLSPEQLREPQTALYYGIILTAAGEEAKAREYLRQGASAEVLPEEQTLLTKAGTRRAVKDR